MGAIVIISNYLVQHPVKIFGLQNLLTYGAFSYPITFLITDLANFFWKKCSKKNCIYWIFNWNFLTLVVSTNFSDLISIRIAIGSGVAFFVAQNLDVSIFHRLRKFKLWYVAPFLSIIGSIARYFSFFLNCLLCYRIAPG